MKLGKDDFVGCVVTFVVIAFGGWIGILFLYLSGVLFKARVQQAVENEELKARLAELENGKGEIDEYC